MPASLGERFVRSFASIYLLCSCYVMSTASTVFLEAEKGMTTGELKYRDSASNGESIYLTHGQYIGINFSTETKCSVVVLNVRYSEGSAVDTATVSIDGQDVGTFRTTATSDSGDPWNDFHDSGQVGGDTSLAAGGHTVMITVSTTDEYGMEVDYIQLQIPFDNTTYENEDATEGVPKGTEHSSLTAGQITGIVFAALVALAVIFLPPTALILYYRRKHKRKEGMDYEQVPETNTKTETKTPNRVV